MTDREPTGSESLIDLFPRVGEVLDRRYRLEKVIAAGGSAVIMRATQLTMDRPVAIKMLLPKMVDSFEMRTRFEREVHLAKNLSHPNIVRLYDFGEAKGILFLAMELLDGEDLRSLIDREGPLPVGRTLDLMIQVADALTNAHRHNIVHRDLKPGNIFLQRLDSDREFVKVLDFGIAKSLETHEFNVTKTGHVTGTVPYVAPELVRGNDPTYASDMYACGLILLEMLLGRRAVDGQSLADTLMMHLKAEVPIPPSLDGTPLVDVIRKATAKSLDHRYGDARTFLHALEEVSQLMDPALRISSGEADSLFDRPVKWSTGEVDSSEIVAPATETGEEEYALDELYESIEELDDGASIAEFGSTSERSRSAKRPLTIGLLFLVVITGLVTTGWYFRDKVLRGPEPAATDPAFVTAGPGSAADERAFGERDDELADGLVFGADAAVVGGDAGGVDSGAGPDAGRLHTVAAATGLAEAVVARVEDAAADAQTAQGGRSTKRRRGARTRRRAQKPRDDEEVEEIDVFGVAEKLKEQEKADEDEAEPAASTGNFYEDARRAFIAKDFRSAIRLCKKAKRRDCLSLIALSYQGLGETKKACEYFQRAGIKHKSCIDLQNR